VVQIPRQTLAAVINGVPPAVAITREQSWCHELESVASGQVVLFDELVGQGETMDAMVKIAYAKDLQVVAMCCLVDFAPDRDAGVYSLYSWRRPSDGVIPEQRRGLNLADVRGY
jgi:hypothetical protein